MRPGRYYGVDDRPTYEEARGTRTRFRGSDNASRDDARLLRDADRVPFPKICRYNDGVVRAFEKRFIPTEFANDPIARADLVKQQRT